MNSTILILVLILIGISIISIFVLIALAIIFKFQPSHKNSLHKQALQDYRNARGTAHLIILKKAHNDIVKKGRYLDKQIKSKENRHPQASWTKPNHKYNYSTAQDDTIKIDNACEHLFTSFCPNRFFISHPLLIVNTHSTNEKIFSNLLQQNLNKEN